MRKLLVTVLSLAFLVSCQSKTESTSTLQVEASNGTSEFKVGEVAYKAKIGTQYFGSDETTSQFSITCQQDEPLALLQITFANEKDATSNREYSTRENFMRIPEGEVSISLSGKDFGDLEYVSPEGKGAVSTKGRTLNIANLKLVNRDGAEKIVNAAIAF